MHKVQKLSSMYFEKDTHNLKGSERGGRRRRC